MTSPSEPVESREQPAWVAVRGCDCGGCVMSRLRSDLAAALAEVSRLREQVEAVRRLADQIEVEIAPFRSDGETVVDRIRAALGDAREGE